MQQCQKCSYEFTLREIQEKAQCPKCAEWAAIDERAREIVQERRVQTAGRSATVNRAMEGMDGARPVVVVDFRMSFGSMVMFMIKWAIASIPALLILFLIGWIAIGVFSGVLMTLS
ncbi:hypothetical protein [Metapseudomonas otitidis]|uniref:hypothetical protein n=1 Tax=Metapseudomonas otitidis TaxID=319939 RepID=UPI0013F67FE0|nr:hypothetical protein [Pseudomonas otitidis]